MKAVFCPIRVFCCSLNLPFICLEFFSATYVPFNIIIFCLNCFFYRQGALFLPILCFLFILLSIEFSFCMHRNKFLPFICILILFLFINFAYAINTRLLCFLNTLCSPCSLLNLCFKCIRALFCFLHAFTPFVLCSKQMSKCNENILMRLLMPPELAQKNSNMYFCAHKRSQMRSHKNAFCTLVYTTEYPENS